MAVASLASSRGFRVLVSGHSFVLGQYAWVHRPTVLRYQPYSSTANSSTSSKSSQNEQPRSESTSSFDSGIYMRSKSPTSPNPNDSNSSLPAGWEDNPNWNITDFNQLPHRMFGSNQHIKVNEEFKEALRQILWQFRAPIRYAFAYGSGVFAQTSSPGSGSLSPHPNPPEAIQKWQASGGKMIDFIFGVSYTQHWHSLNLQQHREHYSAVGSLGSYAVTNIQDRWGAGVFFNPYITVNGIMIKYGVVNLDTLSEDLSTWSSLYLAGRLQKPVKILRDDPRVRFANQVNLISALRTALLMLPERFTERELYNTISGMSYLGDPRIDIGAEAPDKVRNIVEHNLPSFRQLYQPLLETLPNASVLDPRCKGDIRDWAGDLDLDSNIEQDMDPQRRGNMVRRLPRHFREKVYFQYQKKYGIPGREFKKMVERSKDEDEKSFRRREAGEFERRIASETDLKDKVGESIRRTVRWPTTMQTIKNAFTAGIGRSWRYYSEKRAKNKASS